MIKVSYLVSYDYRMLLTSIKQLYRFVDGIVIAIDSNQKTWSGNSFEIPDVFFQELKDIDTKKIITIYKDNFYLPELTPIECESRERNLALKKLGRGWKIQLDVDEYIYDFEKISNYLRKYWYLTLFPKLTPICIKGKLITLFKELNNGYLYIDNGEEFPFITNQTSNTNTRRNLTVRNHQSNIKVIHQSWARGKDEILQKITNWGHRDDFDTQKYFDFWINLNGDNYNNYKNFHPLNPEVWGNFSFLEAKNIDDFIDKFSLATPQKLNHVGLKVFFIALKNKIIKLMK